MFLEFPIICSHVYCYSNHSLTPTPRSLQILHNKYMLILRLFTMWTSSPLTVLGANTIFTSKIYIISIMRGGIKAINLVLWFLFGFYLFIAMNATCVSNTLIYGVEGAPTL
jgi:hypothetical protein